MQLNIKKNIIKNLSCCFTFDSLFEINITDKSKNKYIYIYFEFFHKHKFVVPFMTGTVYLLSCICY